MFVKCLIADAAAPARELLRAILEEMGFDLLEATNGEQVVRLAIIFVPDLIVMDMDITKRSGIEVIATLRRHDAFKDTPIIAVSSVPGEHPCARLRQAGFTDVLVKPVRPATLRSVVAGAFAVQSVNRCLLSL